MYSTLRKFTQAGFTLVELLIVVVILAILAAIVIPQFSSSTRDAQEAALDVNLSAMRAAMELYRAQHNNAYPGANSSVPSVACTATGKGTGAANSAQAFADQLLLASDVNGLACSIGSTPGFKFGPYLRKGIPADPNGKGGVIALQTVADAAGGILMVVSPTGAPITPPSSPNGGWLVNTLTGQMMMNSGGADPAAKDSLGVDWYKR